MAFGTYEGAGELYLNGRLLAEISECEYSLTSNDTEVMTMQKGFSGFSDGPEQVRITFQTAIPKAGYEHDYEDAIRNKRTVRFVFIDGSKRRVSDGRLIEKSSSRSTSAAATSSLTFVGAPVGAR